jgi:hypothetical protein
MYNFLVKNGQRLAFGLGLVIAVVFFVIASSGLDEFNMLPEEEQATTSIFNFGLSATLFLVFAAFVLMLGFGLWHVATNFRGSVKGLIGLAVLAIIFFISYSTASGEATGAIARAAEKVKNLTSNQLKFVGASISTVGILIGLATLGLIASEVRNFFR